MLGEKELCLLLQQNPEKGIGKVMDQYMAFVYTIVHGKLSALCTKQDIEECVSDVFLKLYQSRDNIDLEKGSLKSYLAVLSKRTAIDAFRKIQRKATELSLDEYEWDLVDSHTDIENAFIQSQTSEMMIKNIKSLGEPDSQIIIYKYYFGQSSAAISKILGIKENTINKRASRALEKLRKVLEVYCDGR